MEREEKSERPLGALTDTQTRRTRKPRMEKVAPMETARQWQAVLDAVPDAIVLLDLQRRVVRANEAAATLLGRPRAHLLGYTCHELFHGTSMPPESCPFETVKASRQRVKFEVQLRPGTCVAMTLEPVFNGNGKLVGIVHICRDITERKKAEEALCKTDALFARAQEVAHIGSWRLDLRTGELVWSHETYRIFGVPIGQPVQAADLFSFVHPEDKPWVRQGWDTALQHGRFQAEHRVAAVEPVRWVYQRAELEFDREGKPVSAVGIIQDVTERRKIEEALVKSEHKYRAIFLSAPDGIVHADRRGVIVDVNPAFSQITGIPREHVTGKDVFHLIETCVSAEDAPRLSTLARQVLSGVPVRPFPIELGDKTLEITVCRPGQEKAEVTGILRDITTRRKAEEILRNMAAGVSAATGKEFFQSLVQYLAGALGTEYALIGELAGAGARSIRTLAVWAHGQLGETLECELPGTPCWQAAAEQTCFCTHEVPTPFPHDLRLKDMQVENYVGAPLLDSAGQLRGVVAVLDTKPIANPELAKSMLQIFAVRASAELERARAERALRLSEEKHRLVSENIPVAVYSALPDLHSTTLFISGRIEELTGYRGEQFLKDPRLWSDIVYPEDRDYVWQQIRQHRIEKKMFDIEYRIVTRDGQIKWVRDRAHPTLGEQGQILRVDGFMEDITALKQAEAQVLAYQRQLQQLSTELALAEERERHRIAVGLHDDIGQKLAAAKLELRSLSQSIFEKALSAKIDKVCKQIDEMVADTHTLMFDLSSPLLYDLGFEAAVAAWLSDEIEAKHSLKTCFTGMGGQLKLTPEIGVVLFRGVRELLANVVQHAKARTARVAIRMVDNEVQVTVQDDGVGYVPSKTMAAAGAKHGFGLFSIHEQMAFWGGRMEIRSQPGEGTCVTIAVPLESDDRILRQRRYKHADSDRG